MRISIPPEEGEWLDHHITEEIFQLEDETSELQVKFWTCKAKFTSRDKTCASVKILVWTAQIWIALYKPCDEIDANIVCWVHKQTHSEDRSMCTLKQIQFSWHNGTVQRVH